MLSDVPRDNMGNFTVWPGTHQLFADYYNTRTDEQIQDEAEKRILKSGMPPIEMPEAVQIKAQSGDLVLAHYCLAHAVAPNISPHVRYALFYRFGWNVTQNSLYQIMRRPWLHWNI
jgi:ectoine hydroxylase-related dioxygenase (phytanoyl-CoA dioxygenase family)